VFCEMGTVEHFNRLLPLEAFLCSNCVDFGCVIGDNVGSGFSERKSWLGAQPGNPSHRRMKMIRRQRHLGERILFAAFFLMLCTSARAGIVVIDSAVYAGTGLTYSLIGDETSPGSYSGITWYQANDYAVGTLHGSLATVLDSGTEIWLTTRFVDESPWNGYMEPWIGLYGNYTDGWQWLSDGSPLGAYHPWWPGEPNGPGHGVYGVHITGAPGEWNDQDPSTTWFPWNYPGPMFGIVETSGVPEPGATLLIAAGLALLAVRRRCA
jgi:hypothetical protein